MIKFDDLVKALHSPALSKFGKRLRPAALPVCFVAPPLELKVSSGLEPFRSELIFVEAAAAVGKSTMAKTLSAKSGCPLLDLASIPVASQSLAGLIQTDVPTEGNALGAFHRGELPIVIDALDEGRLLSGERSFEGFLESTGELLHSDRAVVDRPKLIFFGRPEAIELAQIGLDLAAEGPTTTVVQVGFFEELAARELVHAYANLAAAPDAQYRRHRGPVDALISAYFQAIQAALGVGSGKLWQDPVGHAFAGYAPVLAALGSILAELDNFIDVTHRLSEAGTQQAWGVINVVLKEILVREQGKLCEQLRQAISVSVPSLAYDRVEQLSSLAHFAHGQPLRGTGRVVLPAQDRATYASMVERAVPDHPFVRQGRLENPVLGSVVVAHAIANDLIGKDLSNLERFARQPFLWRSLRDHISTDPNLLLDGRYLGYVLHSFWSDPTSVRPVVSINSSDDAGAKVRIRWNGTVVEFGCTLPVTLYGEVRTIDVDIQGDLILLGYAGRDAESSFHAAGRTVLAARRLQVHSGAIIFDGDVWVEAGEVSIASARLELRLKPGSQVGWGGVVAETFPWNAVASTLDSPRNGEPDAVSGFLRGCAARFGEGAVLTLHEDFSVPDNDPHTRWTERSYPGALQRLARALIGHDLASSSPISARGLRGKVTVHLRVSWQALLDAVANPDGASAPLAAVARELKA